MPIDQLRRHPAELIELRIPPRIDIRRVFRLPRVLVQRIPPALRQTRHPRMIEEIPLPQNREFVPVPDQAFDIAHGTNVTRARRWKILMWRGAQVAYTLRVTKIEAQAPTSLEFADLKPRGNVHPSPEDWSDQILYFLLPDRFSEAR